MADQNTAPKRTRKTAEQRAAEFQRKANKARAQANKQKRTDEARRAIVLGKGLLGLANKGDPEAQRIIERVDRLTSEAEKAAETATELSESPVSHALTADEWQRRIDAAHARHASSSHDEKVQIAAEWRQAIVGWERCTGKLRIKAEDRQKCRLGGLGEVLPGY